MVAADVRRRRNVRLRQEIRLLTSAATGLHAISKNARKLTLRNGSHNSIAPSWRRFPGLPVHEASLLRMHRRNASETGCSITSPAGKPAPRRCAWFPFAGPAPDRRYSPAARPEKSPLDRAHTKMKTAHSIRVTANCDEPSISLIEDMVPDFPFHRKNPYHRVPVWPSSDMFHCLPILSVKD